MRLPWDWVRLHDIIHDREGRPVVINSGPCSNYCIERYGGSLNEIENFKTLWVISAEAVCMIMLNRFLKTVQQPVCVVKNGFFANDFPHFDKSKFAEAGIKSVYLPKAPHAVVEAMYDLKFALNEINKGEGLTYGQLMLARSWLREANRVAEDALNSADTIFVEN